MREVAGPNRRAAVAEAQIDADIDFAALEMRRDRVLTCDLTKEYIAINGDYRS